MTTASTMPFTNGIGGPGLHSSSTVNTQTTKGTGSAMP